MRIFIFIGWFRGSVERTDEYHLDLQIGMSRVVSGEQQGLRQDSGGEGRWQARADRTTATASRGNGCGGMWAREAWLEIRRREQVSAQRGSYRWERALSVGVKNSELKPPKQNAFVWISSIQWVFTHYLIGREFWNIFENYWIRCFSSKKQVYYSV